MLDLFAGTGNISFEFASRGSMDITCVDEHAGCVGYVETTAEQLGLEGLLTIQMDVFEYLELSKEKFNVIFADPPYDLETVKMIPNLVFKNELLTNEGWLIIEHKPKHSFEEYLNFKQARKYGSSVFSIFKKV